MPGGHRHQNRGCLLWGRGREWPTARLEMVCVRCGWRTHTCVHTHAIRMHRKKASPKNPASGASPSSMTRGACGYSAMKGLPAARVDALTVQWLRAFRFTLGQAWRSASRLRQVSLDQNEGVNWVGFLLAVPGKNPFPCCSVFQKPLCPWDLALSNIFRHRWHHSHLCFRPHISSLSDPPIPSYKDPMNTWGPTR